MTNMELAFLLGQPKGIDQHKLIGAAKPILLLAAGNEHSDFQSAENIRSAREVRHDSNFNNSTSSKTKKDTWIEEDHKNKTPILNNRTPFIPNQNELPF